MENGEARMSNDDTQRTWIVIRHSGPNILVRRTRERGGKRFVASVAGVSRLAKPRDSSTACRGIDEAIPSSFHSTLCPIVPATAGSF
jgi:hypothetical protein